MDLEYTTARPSDLEEICILVSSAIQAMTKQHIFQWDDHYPTKEDFREDIGKNQLYIGKTGQKIAVIYTLNQDCDDDYEMGRWKYAEEPFYVIHRLCVNPLFQNRGIARDTLLHIEKELLALGIHTIRLDVFSENPFAVKMYDHLGYFIVGHMDRRKGRFYLMEKHME